MVVFLIIGTIAGILLGLRFKVFVLAPVILLATGAIIASGHEPKTTAVTVFGTVVLVQIGYLAGCIVRAYLQAGTTVRDRLQVKLGTQVTPGILN